MDESETESETRVVLETFKPGGQRSGWTTEEVWRKLPVSKDGDERLCGGLGQPDGAEPHRRAAATGRLSDAPT